MKQAMKKDKSETLALRTLIAGQEKEKKRDSWGAEIKRGDTYNAHLPLWRALRSDPGRTGARERRRPRCRCPQSRALEGRLPSKSAEMAELLSGTRPTTDEWAQARGCSLRPGGTTQKMTGNSARKPHGVRGNANSQGEVESVRIQEAPVSNAVTAPLLRSEHWRGSPLGSGENVPRE